MEAGLQIVYAAMAVVGWIFWGKDKTADTLPVTSRPLQFHATALLGILIGTWVSGSLLSAYTDAARPFVDAGTTVSAVVCYGWSPEKYSKTGFIGLLSTRFQSGYLLIGVYPYIDSSRCISFYLWLDICRGDAPWSPLAPISEALSLAGMGSKLARS